ncbi:cytochrome b5-like heme/steroid binding domain-containing protein [Gloeopeniophorella convolvens]|nr:cytochrome b5-like heme/steroid binding domain-containing protein [Gloeopeniophorella convolvens]
MASYLRSWLPTLSLQQGRKPPSEEEEESEVTPTNPSVAVEDADADDDAPPAFPAIGSAQRIYAAPVASSSQLSAPSTLMPPPSLPVPRIPGPPAPSPGSSLMPPPTTTKPPVQSAKSKKREKVALAPGHSPLDWAALKTSGKDLRGGATTLARIPPSVLKLHNKCDDAWAAFNGKVYNITPYLPFHPGGESELMRVAGRDGTRLFSLTHAWVNVDFMLDACLVGFLVSEPSS